MDELGHHDEVTAQDQNGTGIACRERVTKKEKALFEEGISNAAGSVPSSSTSAVVGLRTPVSSSIQTPTL